MRERRHLAWTISVITTLGGGAIIGGLWWATAEHPTMPSDGATPMLSGADVSRFEERWTRSSLAARVEEPAFVRTGVFLQSVEFENANNVTVTGLIWQKLPLPLGPGGRPSHADTDDDGLEPGFFLPEADPGEELMVELAYHRHDRDEEVLGWRFRALLRQDFDYDAYPFDSQEVWLRLLPRAFDRNAVLVPDLLAYDRTASSALPGVERELVLPGWELQGAGFTYKWRDYDTDFGIDDYVGQGGFPELVYSVRIRRAFLGPFVGKIIPLAVAAAMLFCMLLLGTRQDEHGNFGFSALEVVLGAAALFFVVIFDHSALRKDLATTRPFYLEYFYFVMYLALVGVCVNAIAFAMGRIELLQRDDNLLPKLLFWPLYLGSMAAVTTVIFW